MPITPDEIKSLSAPPRALLPFNLRSAESMRNFISVARAELGLPESEINTGSLYVIATDLNKKLKARTGNGSPAAAISPAPALKQFSAYTPMAETFAAPAPIKQALAALPADVITSAQWLAKTSPGKMLRAEFEAMPPAAQSSFLKAGGRIAVPVADDGPQTKNPPANSMWRKDFENLSPAKQTQHFKSGGKVHN